MITDKSKIESLLTQMFLCRQEENKLNDKIDLIWGQMYGLKSPSLSAEHGTPEDRQHKLIRLGVEVESLENQKKTMEREYQRIFHLLKLEELEQDEYDLLELLYRERMTCREIAREIGYNNANYVSRLRIKIIGKIAGRM